MCAFAARRNRYLPSKFLKRTIQAGEHDSAQDAQAAMDLALLKIEKGGAVQPDWLHELGHSDSTYGCAATGGGAAAGSLA